jgi:zinc protease
VNVVWRALSTGFGRHLSLVVACAFALTAWAAPALAAAKIERVVSPGGIEAWLVRDATVPLVAVEFAFKGGSSQDPADKPGVANMITALLDEGAGDLDAAAFQERMEQIAVELRFSDDRDHLRGSLRTLAERRDQAFELLRLALTAPRFEAEAVERIRTQVLAELRRSATNPNDIASKAWWAAAFPSHPYGRPDKGTLESVAQIKPDDLRTYVRNVFAREHLKVAVVGDIDAAAVAAMLDRVFGGLPANAELAPVPYALPEGLGRRTVIEFDVPQAVVSLGGIGLPRKHPDFIAAFVVNHILGGGSFTSRLYQEVREKRGLAYGVSTYLYPLESSALISGWTATRADRAGEAVDLIEAEFRRMAADGPTEEELAKAKDYLKGSYALRFDTSTKIAGQLVHIQLDDLGIDYIERRNRLIDDVTLEDAKRVAKSLLSTGLLVTVVGRPKGITSTSPRG